MPFLRATNATLIENVDQMIPPAIPKRLRIPADNHGSTLPYCRITVAIHGRQIG